MKIGGKSEVVVSDCVIAGGQVSTRVLVAPACPGTDKTGSSPCVDSGGVYRKGNCLLVDLRRPDRGQQLQMLVHEQDVLQGR